MKRSITLVGLVLAMSTFVASASAQASASHLVTISVNPIDQISVSGDLTITISTISLSNTANATYNVTTNGLNRKITASLDADFTSGLTLDVAVTAPSSGTSAGTVSLSSASQDVVTAISSVSESGIAINYTATALPTTPAATSETRTVTYTITT